MAIKKKKGKFDIVSIGGATRDLMFYSGDGELVSTGNLTKQKLLAFEYGAKIQADKLHPSFGGGASNTAVSFSRLGLKTGVICRVGKDDDGNSIIQNLKSKKVDTSLIKTDSKNRSAFSMILTIKGVASEHIIFAYRGASNALSAKDLSLSGVDSKWFYISSLPKIGWEKIMDDVLKKESNIVWNPGSKQLIRMARMKKYLPKVKLLVLNRDEALEFKKLKNIKGLIKHIHSLGPEMVVVTDGAKGAYAYDGNKYYYIKAKLRKSIDTVGVGDAFNSAFTAALIYGNNIKTALKWGATNSASVVGKVGAQNGQLSKRQISK